jgi:hypothetical protein
MDSTITLDTVLRTYADALATFVRNDEVLGAYNSITVVVEDRANIETTISQAIAKATGGVAILVSVTGFRRRQNSGRVLSGTIDFQLSVHENPLFNRKGQFVLTAQCVAERLAVILHWTRLDGFDSRVVFDELQRADDNAANIVVARFHAEQTLNGALA